MTFSRIAPHNGNTCQVDIESLFADNGASTTTGFVVEEWITAAVCETAASPMQSPSAMNSTLSVVCLPAVVVFFLLPAALPVAVISRDTNAPQYFVIHIYGSSSSSSTRAPILYSPAGVFFFFFFTGFSQTSCRAVLRLHVHLPRARKEEQSCNVRPVLKNGASEGQAQEQVVHFVGGPPRAALLRRTTSLAIDDTSQLTRRTQEEGVHRRAMEETAPHLLLVVVGCIIQRCALNRCCC
jgi:hypothetical protein